MINDAMEWLKKHCEDSQVGVEQIHKDTFTGDETFLIKQGSHGKPEVKRFSQEQPKRNHAFDTLAGFESYLLSEHCAKDKGIIFVRHDQVVADLNYQQHGTHKATLRLIESEELMLIASNLHAKGEDNSSVMIAATGLADERAAQSFRVSYKTQNGEDRSENIKLDWDWKGRIWECYERPYVIKLKLQLRRTPQGIAFVFFPQRLERVLSTAVIELASTLRSDLGANDPLPGEEREAPPRFTVHEGTL